MLRNMRTIFCAAPVIFVAALSGCGGGGGAPTVTQPLDMMPDMMPDMMSDDGGGSTIDLTRHLTEAVEQGSSPGLFAAIVDENGVRAIGATGVRRQGSPEELTDNDVIRIGSNTKAMTSTMLATLVKDGTFINGWETTIADVFPELVGKIHQDYHSVSLFQLVRMRGGLARDLKDWVWFSPDTYSDPGISYGSADIIERRYEVIKDSLVEAPTSPSGQYNYSNLSYVLAGSMAEKITGKSWETLMQERLFAPLGMTTAGFGTPGTPGDVDQPWGHQRDEQGAWVASQLELIPEIGPAGTVHLSIEDWAKFVALWFTNKEPAILDRRTLDELMTPASGNYAAGWSVYRRDWAGGTV